MDGETDADAGEGLVANPLGGGGADVEGVDEGAADGGEDSAEEEEGDVDAVGGDEAAGDNGEEC